MLDPDPFQVDAWFIGKQIKIDYPAGGSPNRPTQAWINEIAEITEHSFGRRRYRDRDLLSWQKECGVELCQNPIPQLNQSQRAPPALTPDLITRAANGCFDFEGIFAFLYGEPMHQLTTRFDPIGTSRIALIGPNRPPLVKSTKMLPP